MSRWTDTSPRPRRCTVPAAWKRPESSASRSHSCRGAIAASSLRRSSESDMLEGEQPALVVRPMRAVRAEPRRRHDAMAGHDHGEAVVGAEAPGGPLGARVAGEGGQLAVGHDLAAGHAPQRLRDRELERRAPLEVELDVVERDGLAGEEGAEAIPQLVPVVTVGARPRKLVPQEPLTVEPQLAGSPAVDGVADPPRSHGSSFYNRVVSAPGIFRLPKPTNE